MRKRALVGWGLAWLLMTGAGACAQAPVFPAKPVRFVVVTAAGGGLDVVGRIVADRLSRAWGQTVIVENRPGEIGRAHV